ncbi:putative type VI secretion system protein [Escherichia coli]|nr:putative type VI secretion system protein [Escherichia coli]
MKRPEVSDYLLLQVLNRFGPLLIHMSKTPLSPEVLYRNLCALAGELSTYVRPQTRRPEEYKEYKHLTPYAGLKSVVDEVQYLLNAVLIRGAQRIPLEEGTYGILNAVVEPTELSDFSSLVLAVKAQMSADTLLQHFFGSDQNRAVRTPAGTDSLAPSWSCSTGAASATASDPVPSPVTSITTSAATACCGNISPAMVAWQCIPPESFQGWSWRCGGVRDK